MSLPFNLEKDNLRSKFGLSRGSRPEGDKQIMGADVVISAKILAGRNHERVFTVRTD